MSGKKRRSEMETRPIIGPRHSPERETIPQKPITHEIEAAFGETLPDVVGPECRILFCGINPGLYTAATRTHFGRPGNRFWPALHLSGLTPRLFAPWEQHDLPGLGLGITNLVPWATRTAQELTKNQIQAGFIQLKKLVREMEPEWLAVLGLTIFRKAMGRKDIREGILDESWGSTRIWVLPNPSGLNAHLTLEGLAKSFNSLRVAAGLPKRA
ncbi:MAG: mismatch-specific DNA-glycosylase [Gemmataceae bacterium]